MSNDVQVSKSSVSNQQTWHGEIFPLVLRCDAPAASLDTIVEWVTDQRSSLLEGAERHGAVLFRGFPLKDPQDFDRFIAAFGLDNFPYEQSLSNAVRINYTPRVFSANEAPSDVTIFLHHEMAQTPIFPGKLFFCCQHPADEGGATPLCRSDILLEQMLDRCHQFARDCDEKGLKYTNVMPAENDAKSGMGRSWQSTLRAQDRDTAERRLSELGYTWKWLEDGSLRATTPVLPAMRKSSSGRQAFFNQLIAAFRGWKDSRNDPSKAITFGDGSAMDRDAASLVAELAEQLTFDLKWQQGDIALVDNTLVMHGRRSFRGTRKILASLLDAQKHRLVSAR